MGREIKFRGWFQGINGQEYWAYGYLVKQTNGNWEITNDETSWTVDSVGQFTGLKDKAGKDIYEGDILKTETDKPMVVTWSNKFASFCLNRDGWAFQHWFGEACNPEYCEIIGNIHENQDLLK